MTDDNVSLITLNKPLRCIVKLGGAAVTCKHEIEKINEENLGILSMQLSQAIMASDSSKNVPGMDWSKRPGVSEISIPLDDFREQSLLESSNFIVVHGAGSFGHFQASRSGVHKGGLQLIPIVKAGFVATRISISYLLPETLAWAGLVVSVCIYLIPLAHAGMSLMVTSLNLEIVRALAREGIPSVGMSPFASGWSTCQRNLASADISQVAMAINSGFVPVLHGDAVLDTVQGCTILSGDVIIRHLAELLKPDYVVFLTDVLGVYDRPPTDPAAVLLREIAVDEDGNWSIVKPVLQNNSKQVEITVAAHDTTGGMVTKIAEAALIAKLGIDVYIVKAATDHSLRALKGEIKTEIPDDWLGTVIKSSPS
ncbi:hypothetical protein Scep_017147 [Stephania cephalantha]|uniref:Isopentenyl phosphate kinase n=1 Tax=Stephania cephalantha TaxID=152367 RepID=A0AAP0INW9_9MAGN